MMVTDAPRFVRGSIIHQDLDLPKIKNSIQDVSTKYYNSTKDHPNPRIKEIRTDLFYGNHKRPNYAAIRPNEQ